MEESRFCPKKLTDGNGVERVAPTARLRRVTLARDVTRGLAQAVDIGVLVSTEAFVPVLDESPGGAELFAVHRARLQIHAGRYEQAHVNLSSWKLKAGRESQT